MKILGISGLYHDSAAALVEDGNIVAAAQEERFTRIKQDPSIPYHAIEYCLQEGGCRMWEVDAVVFYDQPLLTLDRYINNVLSLGEDSRYEIEHYFDDVVLSRLTVDRKLREKYNVLGKENKLYTLEHHISHGASAFYPSPFEKAAILTIDGVGEWASVTIGKGDGANIQVLEEIDYPHSLGLLYSAFTAFCGFKVNSGDYKFMGLAPYGEPVYYDLITKELIDVRDDGSFKINLKYFDYYRGKYMTNDKFAALFGGKARDRESRITRREMDIAASAQKVTEEVVLKLARHALDVAECENLVMAGGVALNCVANGKLVEHGIKNIWIQPAAGDAGGALGAALYTYYNLYHKDRVVKKPDSQKGSYLGSEFEHVEIKKILDENGCIYEEIKDEHTKNKTVAQLLSEGKVVGWFQGRMEYGPRALGNRSILGDPRSGKMQSVLNLKIKYRESFRPFAPAVLQERMGDYFNLDIASPYMLLVANVKDDLKYDFDKEKFLKDYSDDMLPVVNAERSSVPAITHIDYSARIQSVSEDTNPEFYRLIKAFDELTGCGMLINTSFNVRGEPIVCTPKDAWLCFMRTEMDVLVVGNYILYKEKQTPLEEDGDWRNIYELD